MLNQLLDHLPFLYGSLVALALTSYLFWQNVVFRRQCPRCGEMDVRRASRKGWQKWFSFVKAYRCTNCGKEFIRLSPDSQNSVKHRVVRR